jgi:hypothetical protein
MNVGMVAFLDEGPRVYMDAPIHRLRSLHPDLGLIDYEKSAEELETALPQIGDRQAQLLWMQKGLGAISADDQCGHISVESTEEIIPCIESLLERYVHPPERTIAASPKTNRTGSNLHAQLRSWFRSTRVYSSKISDLSKGRVVPGYPIDVSDDLYADFALKNGAIHIIQSLDLRGIERVTKGVRGEAGLTAIVLDQARRNLSEDSKRIAVTAADDYTVVKSVVHLVGRYADDVIAMESAADRQRLSEFIGNSLNVDTPTLPFALTV